MYIKTLLTICLLLCGLLYGHWHSTQFFVLANADTDTPIVDQFVLDEPVLSIPSGVLAVTNSTVTVPIEFASNDKTVAGTLFSIDYDETCLAFNGADSNNDLIPDGIIYTLPAAFTMPTSFDASDTDGEIDIIIADFSPPSSLIPDGVIAFMAFNIVCELTDNTSRTAPIRISTSPNPSFTNPQHRSIRGQAKDGSVEIVEPIPVNLTPTPTLIVEPTPDDSGNDAGSDNGENTPTATPMPSSTIELLITPTPTSGNAGDATPTPMSTPVITGTTTPMPTSETPGPETP
ncbi:MAG: cohesin domain-containing protein, partial [Chloroflexota bacterium]